MTLPTRLRNVTDGGLWNLQNQITGARFRSETAINQLGGFGLLQGGGPCPGQPFTLAPVPYSAWWSEEAGQERLSTRR